MTLLLNARVWLAMLLAVVLALSHLSAYRSGIHHAQEACAEERAKAERAAQEQAERNRDLMRQAEKRYVVQQGERDRFIVTTVKELSDAAAPLADCRVPSDVGVRLNAIRSCALGDSAACGGPDGAVPRP